MCIQTDLPLFTQHKYQIPFLIPQDAGHLGVACYTQRGANILEQPTALSSD